MLFVSQESETSVRGSIRVAAKRKPTWSIVIPARNEATILPCTLDALHQAFSGNQFYEIIVVSNQSTDDTARIAESAGARVVIQDVGSVGSARNLGASEAFGDILVFIDADMVVDSDFAGALRETSCDLADEGVGIIGGAFRVPDGTSWVDKTWFSGIRQAKRPSYVPSGLMVITRRLFGDMGGFDELLCSGEDYELSHRVRGAGLKLRINQSLRSTHMGGPQSLRDFLRREIWHGLKAPVLGAYGKVEAVAVAFLACHSLLVFGVLSANFRAVLLSFVTILILVSLFSWRRYRKPSFQAHLLYYLYFWGRVIALARRMLRLGPPKRRTYTIRPNI